jgi:hypothetical protein
MRSKQGDARAAFAASAFAQVGKAIVREDHSLCADTPTINWRAFESRPVIFPLPDLDLELTSSDSATPLSSHRDRLPSLLLQDESALNYSELELDKIHLSSACSVITELSLSTEADLSDAEASEEPCLEVQQGSFASADCTGGLPLLCLHCLWVAACDAKACLSNCQDILLHVFMSHHVSCYVIYKLPLHIPLYNRNTAGLAVSCDAAENSEMTPKDKKMDHNDSEVEVLKGKLSKVLPFLSHSVKALPFMQRALLLRLGVSVYVFACAADADDS